MKPFSIHGLFLFSLIFFNIYVLQAQIGSGLIKNNRYQLGIGAYLSTSENLPFWLHSNQSGEVPLQSQILQFSTQVKHEYDSLYTQDQKLKKFGWGYGARLVANVGKVNQFIASEAYIKGRYSIFEIYAGRRKEIFGLVDTALTSGSYIWSGNALPMPKVQISIPNYTPIFKNGLISIKGGFAHGWFGNNSRLGSYFLHQKWLYVRIGNDSDKVKIYGGFNHQVQWGGISNEVNLNNFYSFFYSVFPLKHVSPKAAQSLSLGDLQNRVGNHLGTLDLAIQLKLANLDVLIYRQNLYEQGAAIVRLANIKDGLNGLTVQTKKDSYIMDYNVEFFYSQNQGTEPLLFTKEIGWELENYFTHYLYTNGWTYHGKVIGTPLITTYEETKDVFRNSDQKINNNRIKAWIPSVRVHLNDGIQIGMKYIYTENRGILINNQISSEFYKQSSFIGILKWQTGKRFDHMVKLSLDNGTLLKKTVGLLGNITYKFL